MLPRLHALQSHLRIWMRRPFALGRADCVTFTCEWVDSQLGTDYLSRVRSELQYTTQLGALRTIQRAGGYESLVARYVGRPARSDAQFQLGDIAIFKHQDMPCTALGVIADQLVYAPSEHGIVGVGTTFCECYWRLDECRQ